VLLWISKFEEFNVMKLLNFICFFIFTVFSVISAQNYINGYKTAGEVRDDLANAEIDSATAENLYEMLENPVIIKNEYELSRLNIIPNISPDDIIEITKIVQSGKKISNFQNYDLIEAFINVQDEKHAVIETKFYPDLQQENDFYKKIKTEIEYKNFYFRLEGTDDTLGSVIYSRSVQYKWEDGKLEIGNYSLHAGVGLLAGNNYPRFYGEKRQFPLNIGDQLLYPSANRLNGIKMKYAVAGLIIEMYGSKKIQNSGRYFTIGGAVIQKTWKRLVLGLQVQKIAETDLPQRFGAFFLWRESPMNVSGEFVFTLANSPSWILQFGPVAKEQMVLSFHRYSSDMALPLGDSEAGGFGSLWEITENDTLQTFLKPEQGFLYKAFWENLSFQLQAFQNLDGKNNQARMTATSHFTIGDLFKISLEQRAFFSEEEQYEYRPGFVAEKEWDNVTIKAGEYNRIVNNSYEGEALWLYFAYQLKENYRIWIKPSFRRNDADHAGKQLISTGEEVNIAKKIKLQSVWNIPVENFKTGWMSITLKTMF
jgi:hypothetical protein